MTNRQIVSITLLILLVLCALLAYSRAEGAEGMPIIYYAHDDLHHVGCWITEQGGIFCMADPVPVQTPPSRRDGRDGLASWGY